MDITKFYFQQGKERYVPLGFRRIRQTYARIVNDVLQTFTFKRYSSGCECTVIFGIYPLCQDITYPDFGLYDLCCFGSSVCDDGRWNYDRNSEISINDCVDSICSHIDRYLIPLFAEANCSTKALPALIALDEDNEKKRQINLLRKGRKDPREFDWRYYSMLRTEKFYMAVKCGQYDYAREVAKVQMPNRRPKDQNVYQSIIDHLDAGNIECIESILHEREKESLKNLEEYRLKPITNYEK